MFDLFIVNERSKDVGKTGVLNSQLIELAFILFFLLLLQGFPL